MSFFGLLLNINNGDKMKIVIQYYEEVEGQEPELVGEIDFETNSNNYKHSVDLASDYAEEHKKDYGADFYNIS